MTAGASSVKTISSNKSRVPVQDLNMQLNTCHSADAVALFFMLFKTFCELSLVQYYDHGNVITVRVKGWQQVTLLQEDM